MIQNFECFIYEYYNSLTEGLIQSVEYSKFINVVDKFLTTQSVIHSIELSKSYDETKDIAVHIDVDLTNARDKQKIFNDLLHLVDNLGYYCGMYFFGKVKNIGIKKVYNVGHPLSEEINTENVFELVFNKKLDISFNDTKLDYLYHTTLKFTYDTKISNKGMVVKNSTVYEKYPDRTYFMTDYNPLYNFATDKSKIIEQQYKKDKNAHFIRSKYIFDWVILNIDYKQLLKLNPTFTLRRDPKFTRDEALYTYDYVPKSVISVFDEFNIKTVHLRDLED